MKVLNSSDILNLLFNPLRKVSEAELCKNYFCYFIKKSTTQTSIINSCLPIVKYLDLYMQSCPPLARYRQSAL